jgi:hypothetical protein
METPQIAPDQVDELDGPEALDAGARERAALELCAAIAIVARNPVYRVFVCGMATSASLLADLDPLAADAGVVLERRVRAGGGALDVVVRAA